MERIIKACVCGHFAENKVLLNGQTIKTKIIYEELCSIFGSDRIRKIDTHGGVSKLVFLPFKLYSNLKKTSNMIILPGKNGLKIIAPVLCFENIFLRRKVHYVVIGGWLPDFLKEQKWLNCILKQFDAIYVETNIMKKRMEELGYNNILVLPNFKKLDIVDIEDLKSSFNTPYNLCTFSRVMKEKGIEDAVEAVKCVNERLGKNIFCLDIYGQVDENQYNWFEELKKLFPDYVNYCGEVDFDKTTTVLKKYFALLFPTFYEGEGFAGTLIDAMASGVPVIASNWKYNSEIIKNNYNGLIVEPRNVTSLSEALDRIYIENKKWICMRYNCINEAQKYIPSKALMVLLDRLGDQ